MSVDHRYGRGLGFGSVVEPPNREGFACRLRWISERGQRQPSTLNFDKIHVDLLR